MTHPFRLVCACALTLAAQLACSSPVRNADWPINGGPDNARYSPLTQITKENVSQLQVAWTYDSKDAFTASEMQSNIIVVDGVAYATTPTMKVVAVNAATGQELWRFDPSGGSTTRTRFRHRGVTVHADRVFVSYRNFLWSLDRKTGQPVPAFGQEGRIDLREGLGKPADGLSVSASTPGVVFEDLIILPSSVPETLPGTPGHIRAFDWKTGQQRWIFHTIPQPGELGYDTWPPDAHKLAGGANAWAGRHRRSRAGDGVRRYRFRVVRLLRHHPSWRQPVLRQRAGARRANREAGVALPGHQARRVGLGLPGAADARDRHPRRPPGGRRGAGDEVRRHVRAGSPHR